MFFLRHKHSLRFHQIKQSKLFFKIKGKREICIQANYQMTLNLLLWRPWRKEGCITLTLMHTLLFSRVCTTFVFCMTIRCFQIFTITSCHVTVILMSSQLPSVFLSLDANFSGTKIRIVGTPCKSKKHANWKKKWSLLNKDYGTKMRIVGTLWLNTKHANWKKIWSLPNKDYGTKIGKLEFLDCPQSMPTEKKRKSGAIVCTDST